MFPRGTKYERNYSFCKIIKNYEKLIPCIILDMIKYDNNNVIIIGMKGFKKIYIYKYVISLNKLRLLLRYKIFFKKNKKPMILCDKNKKSIYTYIENNGIYCYSINKNKWYKICNIKNKILCWWINNNDKCSNIHYFDYNFSHWNVSIKIKKTKLVKHKTVPYSENTKILCSIDEIKPVFIPKLNVVISFSLGNQYFSRILMIYKYDLRTHHWEQLRSDHIFLFLDLNFGTIYDDNKDYIILYNTQGWQSCLWYYNLKTNDLSRKDLHYSQQISSSKVLISNNNNI